MKLVIQRVSQANVTVNGQKISEIGKGVLVLIGIKANDTLKEADVLIEKLAKLRIMSDTEGKMNLTVKDVKGEILLVSQFTLYADTKGGNRPSFTQAGKPEAAKFLYSYFIEKLRAIMMPVPLKTGQFGAAMKISTELDGPVTLIIEQ